MCEDLAGAAKGRVLIVRLGAFGDIIHTLPLAADLAASGWTVDWLCEDRWAVLLDGNPAVSRVHQLPRAAWRRSGAGLVTCCADLRRLARTMQAIAYDAVIDAQGLAKSAVLALASGGRRRIGHAGDRARELSWLVSRNRVPTVAVHVIDQQRALGLPLHRGRALAAAWAFPLPAFASEAAEIDAWLVRSGLTDPWMLNVGAGWPSKVWPESHQQAFVSQVLAAGHHMVLVWGSPAERAVAARLASATGAQLALPTSLASLAPLLARAAVVVSADTGPLHLAMAVGTPTVGLFGPVPAERNGPRGRGHCNVQGDGRAWERHDAAKGGMAAITPEAVMLAAGQVVTERTRP